jgi:hypothetical protein
VVDHLVERRLYRKPENWISATGLRPIEAMPIAMPTIAASASGRVEHAPAPKRCCSPAVARNTPPLAPMSSPSSTTGRRAQLVGEGQVDRLDQR